MGNTHCAKTLLNFSHLTTISYNPHFAEEETETWTVLKAYVKSHIKLESDWIQSTLLVRHDGIPM